MSTAQLHPVICPCGHEGAPKQYPSLARRALARHQNGNGCPLSPQRQEQERRKNATGPCVVCQIEQPHPKYGDECWGCHKARNDHGSPLDLGGQWVRDKTRGVLVWKAVA